MKKKLLGYYDYTVVLTYCGMLFAFCGIMMSIGGKFLDAILCLLLAGVCDMFDGAVAATKERDERAKRFGIQIDSLSDLISFGVLPAIFVYMLSEQDVVAGVVASFYTLCALIRLAYFNVLEEDRQRETEEKRTSYLGVPVTTIAVLLPGLYMLHDLNIIRQSAGFCALLILVAVGFIIPLHIKKPKIIGKICLIVIGVAEVVGMVFLLLWGAV